MSNPFLGQIQPLGFGFAPKGWMLCNGQTLPVSQYAALFSLLGTQYGGNGTTTFLLPNLQSRVPMHQGTSSTGNSYVVGEQGGEENVTLLLNNMPLHNHNFLGTSQNANASPPENGVALATAYEGTKTPVSYYAPSGAPQPLNPASLKPNGSGQPHTNIQPYLAINWCIATVGVFPTRS
ncbi:MAG: tail fiber protein [Xanthobacteraceae bacterium]|jgi:microcystin-dependent protein